MACHVLTYMAHGEDYIWGVGAVRRSRGQQEGKIRKKKKRERKEEREEKKREREGEERERKRKRKGKRCSDGRNSSDQEAKFVYSMRVALQEVGILSTLVSLYHLSYCFGMLLGLRCAMFMACFVVLNGICPILRSQLRRGSSRSKGLLPERIWVEKLRVQELPKCSCNPWAHYCVDWRNSVALIALQLWTTISLSSEIRFTRSWTL